MITPVASETEFATGDRMTVEEFLHSWEDLPDLKNAELIDGVVHVSSPVSYEQGNYEFLTHLWLGYYASATPGCQAGSNSTWLMLDSAPQPDAYLRILPAYGGQSTDGSLYAAGAPELAVEICLSSADVDFGSKRRLYQKAGVREYVAVATFRKKIIWHVLVDGVYLQQELPGDGILRSLGFPGLWLDVAAFWATDGAKLLAALNAGLDSEEHRAFVERLAAAKQ